jgi:hypothetical protein
MARFPWPVPHQYYAHTYAELQPFAVGPYRFIAVPAVHNPVVEPLLYPSVLSGDR